MVGAVKHGPKILQIDDALSRLMKGETRSFPGNATLMQYFQMGFYENRVHPTTVALIDDESERRVTFSELDVLSGKLALVLKNRLRPIQNLVNENPDGDIVFGICAPPTDRLIALIFAVMKLGGAYVPFDVSFPESRVVRIVDVSKPIMIISDSTHTTLAKFDPVKSRKKIVTLDELIAQVDFTEISSTYRVTPFPMPSPSDTEKLADRTAVVLFTSGSSGEPKGVRLSHKEILNRLNWQWEVLPFAPSECCCLKTTLTFVDSVLEIFGPLLQGHPVVVLSKSVVTQSHIFVEKMEQHKIGRLAVVPSFVSNLLSLMEIHRAERDSQLSALNTIKTWMCTGEILTRSLLERFFSNFTLGSTTIYNFYGSTEIMDVAVESFGSMQDVDVKCIGSRAPLGQPIFNTLIYILNDKMEIVEEEGQLGEIIVAGYNLAKGYVGIRDSDKFIVNPFSKTPGFSRLYRTGDYGRIQPMTNGRSALFYDGRVDSQVKVRGHRVDLSEIETTINGLTAVVKKCVVLCHQADEPHQAILAFCIVTNNCEGTKDRIISTLKSKLLPYQMPTIRIVKELPYLVNGKVDRQRLLCDYREESSKQLEFSDWEQLHVSADKLSSFKVLIQTMSTVTCTSVRDIVQDLDNSFYNLGGTSLNSILVIAGLRKLGYIISIYDFVTAKTIRKLHMAMRLNDNLEKSLAEYTQRGMGARKKFTIEILKDGHKNEVIYLVSSAFVHKGDLESYVHVTMSDYEQLLNLAWSKLFRAECSFVVRRKNDSKIIGASLNFDAYDEPDPDDEITSGGLKIICDFGDFLREPVRAKLLQGKEKVMYNYMVGTHEDLSDAENVHTMEFMQEEIIRLGYFHNFMGIYGTFTSALTQQISMDIQGYTALAGIQLNQYVTADGKKPFLFAPDCKKVYVCWKELKNIRPTQKWI